MLNIGGGKFSYPGWVNLDERNGFTLSPKTVFPDGHDLIYSSHCLEHLDDETVDRMLSESRRVGKTLVLKLPDFELVLERLKARDDGFFQKLGLNKLVRTWPRDSLEMRAAMMFCGYWTKEYGHEFLGPRNLSGYHGPPVLSDDEYRELFKQSPHEIARRLVPLAKGTLNHRNAWNRAEIKSLLERHGFTIHSEDPEEICRLPIPTIREMFDISLYVQAV